MNFKSFRLFLLLVSAILTMAPRTMAAQTTVAGRTVTCKVQDKVGPIPGANVLVTGTQIGGFTDADGVIVLAKVPSGAVLEVSFVGYISQKITVGSKSVLTVTLEEDKQAIDESVVIAYGHQKKVTVTGAIESVKNEQLVETQVPNFANALAGRVAGLTTIQDSGQPGYDAVTIYLRGQGTSSDNTPLVLIDGVPSDEKADKLGMMDVNEVASVTILKDAASTAIFGSRGANGVILITTRRGEAGKNVLEAQVTTSVASLHFPWTRISSAQHAQLRNQALRNDGLTPAYSDWQIEQFKANGGDPFFPNRNIYKENFAKFAPTERVSLNISGGSKKTRYFSNFNVINQDGNVKILPKKDLGYNAQFSMLRYTIRNNFDFNLNERLKLTLNLSIYFQKMTQPSGGTDVFVTALQTPPTNPGPLTVAGYGAPAGQIVARENSTTTSAYATLNRSGYYMDTNFSLISKFIAEYDFSKFVKGLSMQAVVAYNDFASGWLSGSQKSYDAYTFSRANGPGEQSKYVASRINQDETFSIGTRGVSGNQMLQLHFITNYDRQFGDHTIGAMVFAQAETKMTNAMNKNNAVRESLPYKYAGVAGRVQWAYLSKYMAEFDAGYNGSEQFAPSKRFGFFPAVSGGWVISSEPFMKNNPVISLLKVRASVGKVGNDRLGTERFIYYSTVSKTAAGYAGSLNHGLGVEQVYMGNPDVQWEDVIKQNYGVEMEFLKNFRLEADIFHESCDNRLYSLRGIPAVGGIANSAIPRFNLGSSVNRGFEVKLNWGKQLRQDLKADFSGQFSYAKNKIVSCGEPELDDSYLYRKREEGFMSGQCWGLAIDYSNGNGFINTEEELERAREMYNIGTPRLGDFLYKDSNNDGYIDDRDLVPIGNSVVPVISYGFNFGIQYKRISLSAQFNGMGKVSAYRMGLGVSEQGAVGSYTDYHLRAWTPERYANGQKIEYPALSTVSGVSHRANDFFINNRSYLRLKNLEIAYGLPQNRVFKSLGVAGGSIFFYGNNVFIIDGQRVRAVDAETSGESIYYPLNQTYSLGVNLKF
ncbi:MAG: TonB-dependent receptor [Bacteroidales bacterium]|nr:TonB-dependent receptor [Bacteroidales bacterium]